MKGTILIIALLVMSLFAGALALADDNDTNTDDEDEEDDASDNNTSTDDEENDATDSENDDNDTSTDDDDDEDAADIEDIAVESVESEDVKETLDDLETPKNYNKMGFVKVWVANGWLENGEKGTLVNGFWAVQNFVKINKNTNETEVKHVRALGVLHIAGYGNFKLARVKDSSDDNNTVSFYLVSNRDSKQYESEETLSDNSIGTLVLTKEAEYGNLVTWNGKLTLDEGKNAGTYDVELGTNVKTMKPKQAAAVADATKAARKTFWQRMQFWKNWEGNKPGNSEDNSSDDKIKPIKAKKLRTTD